MSEPSKYSTRAALGYELAVKIAVPLLLGVSAWTFTQLLDHGNRLTVLEVRNEAVRSDVVEIKQDVKKLLEAR